MAENTARLRLDLVDVRGRYLKESVTISAKSQTTSAARLVRGVRAEARVEVTGLKGPPQNLYLVRVTPRTFYPVARFSVAKRSPAPLRMVFPVRESAVKAVEFPAYEDLAEDVKRLLRRSTEVDDYPGTKGAELYEAIGIERRAGLLNILAKSAETEYLGSGRVLRYLADCELLRIVRDRIYARVPREMFEATAAGVGARFSKVSGLLHRPFLRGYTGVASFKTRDDHGVLQLTFSQKEDQWLADIDIDEAGGFEHIFEVVRNAVKDSSTHPFRVHQILLGEQGIDPGYDLITTAA